VNKPCNRFERLIRPRDSREIQVPAALDGGGLIDEKSPQSMLAFPEVIEAIHTMS